MNILSIGNSYSQDATRYLHDCANNQGWTVNTLNLYIGGCPLENHYRNMLSNAKAYGMDYNGYSVGINTSIDEALFSRTWDIVTVQQASHFSNKYETYQPYLNELAAHIRKIQPKAKVFIHETWGYRENSDRLTKFMKYDSNSAMYADVHVAYMKAFDEIKADGIIRSGLVLNKLIKYDLYRDDIHASLGAGRYALALNFLKTVTGADVTKNTLSTFDEPISDELLEIIRNTVAEL